LNGGDVPRNDQDEKMTKRWFGPMFAAMVLLTACVTINVHFPAVEAREAAREFVDDVIGRPADADAGEDLFDGGGMALAPARARFDAWALLGIGTAHAQGPDITVSTPAIDGIRARMRERFRGTLRPHFDSGALGFGRDGSVQVRDAGAIPLSARVAVNQAVAEQNRDARAVYREIAVANGNPQWEGRIAEVFARQWIERSKSGWWYQDSSGSWRQK